MTFYAYHQSPTGDYCQVLVTKVDGYPSRVQITGKRYQTQHEADDDMRRLNCKS